MPVEIIYYFYICGCMNLKLASRILLEACF